jgi:hypothetical protein
VFKLFFANEPEGSRRNTRKKEWKKKECENKEQKKNKDLSKDV